MVALVSTIEREVGPQGIHVAQVVIDGAIDPAFIAKNFPEPSLGRAMHNKTLEFYFDGGSPTSYLAHTQRPRIAAETGAALA